MLTDVRQALADALAAGVPGVQSLPYIPSQPMVPSAWVFPSVVSYDEAFSRGMDEWTFTVQAVVGTPNDRAAQERLDRMLEPAAGGVKAALEADRTLGGLAFDVDVRECTGYRVIRSEGHGDLLGAEWTVVVKAEGA